MLRELPKFATLYYSLPTRLSVAYKNRVSVIEVKQRKLTIPTLTQNSEVQKTRTNLSKELKDFKIQRLYSKFQLSVEN